MKAIGEKLDLDFEVNVSVDGKRAAKRFGDLIDGPTIVSVYMRNNTGSCDKQMISLASSADTIRKQGFALIGLSKDTVGSHQRFASKHGIDFDLVSDPEHRFAQATGSLVEKKMYGKTFWGPTRTAYAIAADGTLLGAIEVDSPNHGEQILDWIPSL